MKRSVASLTLATGITLSASGGYYSTPTLPNINTNNTIIITNAAYGAMGDGLTTNTVAIQTAINKAAAGGTTNGAAGGTVEIPAGTNAYLCGPLTLASSVNFQIDAGAILRMLPFGQYPVTWFTNGGTNVYFTAAPFISANNLHDIEISGSGAIDGQGSPWWPWSNTNHAVRAVMLSPSGCNRLLIQNVTLSNSPTFHIAVGGNAGNTTVRGVTIRAPASSPNTDACDVSGTNVLVQNCNISEGDDDYTCGGGTSGVLLTNNTYGSGHGISIGSYTDGGGVSNITVINCTMNGTVNGIRIKSDDGRGGVVQNISYYNIGMTNVDFPIQIYSYYLEDGTPSGVSPLDAGTEPVLSVSNTTPVFRNITFSNITATSVSGYPIGILWARTELPMTNIVFDRINLAGYQSFDLYNVSGAQFIDSTLSVSSGTPTFELFNAQVILTNSAPANRQCTFDGLTTNGYVDSFALYNAQASLQNTNAFGTGPLTLSASTLTISNNLALFPATTLNYTLGTNAAKLAVVGNLTLGGTNDIFAGSGFTNGTYTLLTYTGTLGGSPPALGSTPAGYYYSFDTSIPGEINLDVSTTAFSVPPAPTNLVATPGDQLVALSWSPAATATSYNVMRATTNNGTYPTVYSGILATNYSDAQVTNGTTYYYVVSAVNTAGMGANSAMVNATPATGLGGGGTGTIFSDAFSTSTVDSASPSAPTGTATSYEVVSSKPWSPTPSVASGHLKYGIGTTTSGCIEVQALFAAAPVALASVGSSLALIVTFTDTSGLLTESGTLGLGVYDSGQNAPVPGGLNGDLSSSSSGNAAGNAQMWAGYAGQLAFTGGSSYIMTRPPQTGTDNNNQDTATSGSSASYSNPTGATVGTASFTPSVTLVAGNPYTAELTLTLTASNSLAITNFLYSGANTNGTLLSQFGGVAAGGTYLTNAFDALAIGWHATANTTATAIDINQISVIVASANQVQAPAAPANLVASATNLLINLAWNSVANATNYNLLRGTVSGSYPTVFSGLTATNYADANVTNAVTYYYVVNAVGAGGQSTNSLPASAIPLPSNQPANLMMQVAGNQLQLSWPQDHLGWQLQIQTNNLGGGLGTNWVAVPNTSNVLNTNLAINPTNGSVFLRLVYP